MCCRILRLCVQHIWPEPSGNDWFTSLLSSPSNTFLSRFNLGAAQQAATAHTSTNLHTNTHTHIHAQPHMDTHLGISAQALTHTVHISKGGSVLLAVTTHHFQPFSSKGWAPFSSFSLCIFIRAVPLSPTFSLCLPSVFC